MLLEDVSLPSRWIVKEGGASHVHGTGDGAWLSWGMVDMVQVHRCLGWIIKTWFCINVRDWVNKESKGRGSQVWLAEY